MKISQKTPGRQRKRTRTKNERKRPLGIISADHAEDYGLQQQTVWIPHSAEISVRDSMLIPAHTWLDREARRVGGVVAEDNVGKRAVFLDHKTIAERLRLTKNKPLWGK